MDIDSKESLSAISSKLNINVKEVVKLLESSKQKDRQDGIAGLRKIFKSDRAVQSLDPKGEGKPWLFVFQAVFAAALIEKQACIKKGLENATAVSLKRLEEVGAVLRWLTRRALHRINRKVVKPLLSHLLQMLVHKGGLLSPIVDHYAKALRILLTYQPHLDHLDIEHWEKILSLSFSIVLGDPLRSNAGLEEDNDGLEQDGDEDENEVDEELELAKSSRKRSLPASMNTSSVRPSTFTAASSPPTTLSNGQIEFMSIISHILGDDFSPYLSSTDSTMAQIILSKLRRFFQQFPIWTSAHADAISATNSIMSHLELNALHLVKPFAAKIIDPLLSLWSSSGRNPKEGLLIAVKTIFPLVASTGSGEAALLPGRLDRLLEIEADSKGGPGPLPLDCLRLTQSESKETWDAFETIMFQNGSNFGPPQSFTWATLELHADCLFKVLSQTANSIQSSEPAFKRARVERRDRISAILEHISSGSISEARVYRLQIIYFFIHRHLPQLSTDHLSNQPQHERGYLLERILSGLLGLIQQEPLDHTVQSWVLLCLGAFVLRIPAEQYPSTLDVNALWRTVLTHINTPQTCRAACHVGDVFLRSGLLNKQVIASEVESITKNLTVHGPQHLYDSVSGFFTSLIRLTHQDVRLHRLHLEDAVLSWLIDKWRLTQGNARNKLELYTVGDVLALLESTCNLKRSFDPVCSMLLPDDNITEVLLQMRRTEVIRAFVRHGKLPTVPPPSKQKPKPEVPLFIQQSQGVESISSQGGGQAQPRSNERKVSSFLLKCVESLVDELEIGGETSPGPSLAKIRSTIDVAVLALSFETSLNLNGIRFNTRVLKVACHLLGLLTPHLESRRWNPHQRALILLGLEPLVRRTSLHEDRGSWEVMLPAGSESGISHEILSKLSAGHPNDHGDHANRKEAQALLWTSVEFVYEGFAPIVASLRRLVEVEMGSEQVFTQASLEVDSDDDFGGTKGGEVEEEATVISQSDRYPKAIHASASICLGYIVTVEFFRHQELLPGPWKDSNLVNLMLQEQADARFFLLIPSLLEAIKRHEFDLTSRDLSRLLEHFTDIIPSYACIRSQKVHLLALQILEAITPLLLKFGFDDTSDESPTSLFQDTVSWLVRMATTGKIRSWAVRDKLAQFLGHHVSMDPTLSHWPLESEEQPVLLPSEMLAMMMEDPDIRVRFRVAVASARVMGDLCGNGSDPNVLYNLARPHLCNDISNHEHMLTRFLTLGNYMVINSSVRRGPYWHLLETEFHTDAYTTYVEAVLRLVAARLGFKSLSSLFESHATHIAHATSELALDFAHLPPKLLGYEDIRAFSNGSFPLVSPMLAIRHDCDNPDGLVKQPYFTNYSRSTHQSEAQALAVVFPAVIGWKIAFFLDENTDPHDGILSDENNQQLGAMVETWARRCLDDANADPQEYTLRSYDHIVFHILRLIQETDYSTNGPIASALASSDAQRVSVFNAVNTFRSQAAVHMHQANPPHIPTLTLIRCFKWLANFTRSVPTSRPSQSGMVYHVIRLLIAAIGQTPLVNEQLRLVNALCLHVAYHSKELGNQTLLRTLMHGSFLLLGQFDLAYAAQSLLDWTIDAYLQLPSPETSQLPDLLSGIAQLASKYAANSTDCYAQTLGSRLMTWIIGKSSLFLANDHFRPQLLTTIPLWPPSISCRFPDLGEDLGNYENLAYILKDSRAIAGKFRIVQRLRDAAPSGERASDAFAHEEFWQLKSCIPQSEDTNDDDVEAFVDLLYSRAGHVRTMSDDPMALRTLGMRFWVNVQGSLVPPPAAQQVILALHSMLSSQPLDTAHLAYTTLRRIFGAGVLLSSIHPSTDTLRELKYISTYPISKPVINDAELTTLISDPAFSTSCSDYPLWISSVTTLLSNVLAVGEGFYSHLSEVLRANVEFAQEMLPPLVHRLLLASPDPAGKRNPSNRDILSQYFSSLLVKDNTSTACKSSIVNLILHLRHIKQSPKTLPYEHWLNIDFLVLSKSAADCGAYTTALLFLELAAETMGQDAAIEAGENILYDIYGHIEEPDGFYGIKSQDPHIFLIQRLHHEHLWEKALQFHAAGWNANPGQGSKYTSGMTQALRYLGWEDIAMHALHSNEEQPDHENMPLDLFFELGWRTDQWDLPLVDSKQCSSSALYCALRAVHGERHFNQVDETLRQLLQVEVQRLSGLGNEDMTAIKESVSVLLSLREIRKWHMTPNPEALLSSLGNEKAAISHFQFEDLERVNACRLSVIRALKQRETSNQIGDIPNETVRRLSAMEQRCLIHLTAAARESSQVQAALNSISRARVALEPPFPYDLVWEYASVLWMQGEQNLAVESLRALAARLSIPSEPAGTPTARLHLVMAQLGDWISKAGLEQPAAIQKQYFQPSVELSDQLPQVDLGIEDELARSNAYHQYALFAERQYQLSVQSPEYERRRLYVERMKDEVIQLQSIVEPGRARDAHLKKSRALLDEDEKMFSHLREARFNFLSKSIDMFARCLSVSDQYNEDTVIRLCSLWFSNFFDNDLNHLIEDRLLNCPSHKFIFLSHQLSSRLAHSQTHRGQEVLQKLMRRLCGLHPFHTVYQIYALYQGCPSVKQAETQLDTGSTRRSSRSFVSPVGTPQADRALAALSLLEQLENDQQFGSRIRNIQTACEAFLEFARWPVPPALKNTKGVEHIVPAKLALSKLHQVKIPIITDNVEADPTGKYDQIVYLQHYKKGYTLAGGVNLPKIISCEGSDGVHYKQLFKGQGDDDLRQDAVMEQVFDLVNILLLRYRETRRRQLCIRTYKVVPLAPTAGVIEFVRSTIPLAEQLQQAHKIYRPRDISEDEARRHLIAAGRDPHKLLEAFEHIRRRLKPVMRHIFTTMWRLPMAWHFRRLNYTRSVVTTSIVGHIIGLGDRHLSNILLDHHTGEVVHIDLGIAFEQGRRLPIPELIPFRLTADIVDGMGIFGVEGVFRRCAEETLKVLREESNVIMTVLEVFKTDPLHSWTASAVKVRRAQHDTNMTSTASGDAPLRMESDKTEEQADRALSTVRQKLDKSLSVSHNVNELIAQATDPENLSKLFIGWRPWY